MVVPVIVLIVLLALLSGLVWPRRWQHRVFAWHDGGRVHGFDGASFYGRCSICGLRVLQDSQGGWFPSSVQDDPALDAAIAHAKYDELHHTQGPT